MRYKYQCRVCQTDERVVRTRAEMRAQRDRHRRLMHGGATPWGERLLQQRSGPRPAPTTVALLILAALVLAWIVHG